MLSNELIANQRRVEQWIQELNASAAPRTANGSPIYKNIKSIRTELVALERRANEDAAIDLARLNNNRS